MKTVMLIRTHAPYTKSTNTHRHNNKHSHSYSTYKLTWTHKHMNKRFKKKIETISAPILIHQNIHGCCGCCRQKRILASSCCVCLLLRLLLLLVVFLLLVQNEKKNAPWLHFCWAHHFSKIYKMIDTKWSSFVLHFFPISLSLFRFYCIQIICSFSFHILQKQSEWPLQLFCLWVLLTAI